MMSSEGVDSLSKALARVITYHRDEWDLSYAEAIGCLEFCKLTLWQEAHDTPDDDPEDEE